MHRCVSPLEAVVTFLVAANGAIVRLEGDRFRPAFDGLPDGNVQALARAPDGSIWIGMSPGGLVQVRGGTISPYTRRAGLRSDNVRTVAVDRAGRVWIGTREGEVQVLSTGRQTTHGAEELGIPRTPDGGNLTVSVGVATAAAPAADGDARGLVARADRAMYHAKQQGKNRVASADEAGPGAAVA